MKRLMSVLLAGLLCLQLAACVQAPVEEPETEATKGKYDDLIQMLEKGDYTGALSYILSLDPDGTPLFGVVVSPSDPEPTPSDPEASDPEDPELTALKEDLPGQWLFTGGLDAMPSSLEFSPDGTCTVDGTAATWEIDTSVSDPYLINISDEQGIRIVFFYDQMRNGDTGLECVQYRNHEGSLESCFSNYYYYIAADRYEIVELTTSNYSTYFQFIEDCSVDRDAFGDPSQFWIYWKLAMKPEYAQRMPAAHNFGAVTISFRWETWRIGVSSDYDAYSLISYDGWQDSVTSTDDFRYGDNTWYTSYWSRGFSFKEQGYYVDVARDEKVTRIQGTLYLLKNS